MKIAFVINGMPIEMADYSTTYLALAALRRGHEVWYISVDDFAYDPDDHVHARAIKAPAKRYRSAVTFMRDLQSPVLPSERITVDELDVMMLRNDPSLDALQRIRRDDEEANSLLILHRLRNLIKNWQFLSTGNAIHTHKAQYNSRLGVSRNISSRVGDSVQEHVLSALL